MDAGCAWSQVSITLGLSTCAPLLPCSALDAYRHGGLTEVGDAGAADFEGMAASMHKTPSALRLYVKRSETQRTAAARKRRQLIERKRGT
jgi:hypothetical protein